MKQNDRNGMTEEHAEERSPERTRRRSRGFPGASRCGAVCRSVTLLLLPSGLLPVIAHHANGTRSARSPWNSPLRERERTSRTSKSRESRRTPGEKIRRISSPRESSMRELEREREKIGRIDFARGLATLVY